MSGLLDIIRELVAAWKEGRVIIRSTIILALITTSIAIIVSSVGKINPYYQFITEQVSSVFGIISAALALIIVGYQKYVDEEKNERKLEEAEKRVQENPKETQAAWELARVKLESYLNRNLNQVRSIFWLTVFVMLVGFSLIGFGVYNSFFNPGSIQPSIIATASGILVNFIGATFLILYKSTMAQATDYVTILERINAVGMSVQILETLDGDEKKLKEETTAEIAKQLLVLYSNSKIKKSKIKKK